MTRDEEVLKTFLMMNYRKHERIMRDADEIKRLRFAWQTALEAESAIAKDRDEQRDRADRLLAAVGECGEKDAAQGRVIEELQEKLRRADNTIRLLEEHERWDEAKIEELRK